MDPMHPVNRNQNARNNRPAGPNGGYMIPKQGSLLRVKTQFQSLTMRGLLKTQQPRPGKNQKGPGSVRFGILEVREFPMVLGDNPSCMEGAPITIDWGFDPNTHFTLDVNTFERLRGRRRRGDELIIPKEVREKWLLNCGIPKKDIVTTVRQCRRDKHNRMVSCHNQSLDPMHEAVEKASKNIKRIFAFKKSAYEKSLEDSTKNQYPYTVSHSSMSSSRANVNYLGLS